MKKEITKLNNLEINYVLAEILHLKPRKNENTGRYVLTKQETYQLLPNYLNNWNFIGNLIKELKPNISFLEGKWKCSSKDCRFDWSIDNPYSLICDEELERAIAKHFIATKINGKIDCPDDLA